MIKGKFTQRFNDYLRRFSIFEIDMSRFLSTNQIMEVSNSIKEKGLSLSAIHLPYHDTDLEYGLSSVPEVRKLDANVLVLHLCYPKNRTELEEQLSKIADIAEKFSVHIAIENLADRKNKSCGFMKAKDPISLAQSVLETGSKWLVITLDTSHAICNEARWWGDPYIIETLMHVHLSGGAWAADLHTSLETSPISDQIPLLIDTLKKCNFKGMISLENNDLETSLVSLNILKSLKNQKIC